jgi:hypothetical protein
MVAVDRVVEPRADLATIYDDLSDRSRRLYRALNESTSA